MLDDETFHRAEIIKKYNFPKGLKTVDINHLIPDLNETIEPYSSLDGGSTPIDIALLKGLARKMPDCKYFEIGTWRGESVANVASVAKQCTTLNLPDAEMLQMGLDKAYVESHRFFSKNLKNVTHIQANSQTFDYAGLNQKFDLIFVDGDHHYESVKNDTSNVFKLLKNDDSIIIWHDYGNNPNNIRWDVLHGILDGMPADEREHLYRVSHTLCAIYIKKTIPSAYPMPYPTPSKFFSLEIKNKNTKL
ncbi:MAG: class I SAM-dependent methyltransferase [Bacteroidota bacterium]